MLPERITPSVSYPSEPGRLVPQKERGGDSAGLSDAANHLAEGAARSSSEQALPEFLSDLARASADSRSHDHQVRPDEISESTRQAFASRNIRIAFEIDKETQRMFIALRDMQTGELIRQIPPEEQLRWAERIDAYLQSLQLARETDTSGEKGLLLSTRA
ncbi:FlaG protein [Sulfurivirga caldicuralii]|uniref:FlaG protein n=1 Tax=Sulfurivirga caldicuralii TaxID=364032 RepID=A0A1N6FMY1_9GAMM|nr:flagellar protein FlaG [Sulfurivirga caldicuralii]SIN96592.1 FlaG protein [Sulfurivirga caldicuralii]